VILISIAGSAIGFLVTGLSTSFEMLIAARCFSGLMGGSIPVAQAYISDVTTDTQRTRYLGLIGACIGIAFTVGPAVGATLITLPGFDYQRVLLCGAGFSFLAFLQALLRLEEPKKSSTTAAAPKQSVCQILCTSRAIQVLLMASFVCNYNFQVMQSLYAVMLQDFFGRGSTALGSILTGSGVVLASVQACIIKRLLAAFGELGTGALGCILLTIFGLLFPVLNTNALFIPHLLAFYVYVAGFAIANTAIPSLLASFVEPSQRGSLLGLGSSTAAMARVVCPIASAAMYDYSNTSTSGIPFVSMGQLPFLVGSSLTLLGALSIFALRNSSRPLEASAAGGTDQAQKLREDQELPRVGEASQGA